MGEKKEFVCVRVGITDLRCNLPVGGRYNTCVPGPHIKKVGAGSWPRCGSKTPSLCNRKPFTNIYQRPVNDCIEIEMLPSVFRTPLSEIVLILLSSVPLFVWPWPSVSVSLHFSVALLLIGWQGGEMMIAGLRCEHDVIAAVVSM